jgi:Mce-associated membrane protein
VSTIDLYAVLGVARDASGDEIRAAWKSAVADMEPTDPKLNVFNQAGAVLLDPAKREKYDAELAAAEGEAAGGSDRPASPGSDASAAPDADLASDAAPAGNLAGKAAVGSDGADKGVGAREVPGWVLATLAALTVAVVLAATFAAGPLGRALPAGGVPESQQRLVDAADAAEKAAVPVLSYDYRHLDQDEKAATAQMTSKFRKDYEQTFTLIKQNAPQVQAVVAVKVLGSAISHTSDKTVDVLLFVDRPTSKKGSADPVVYRDQVTFTMRLVGGEWRIDDMRTTRPA